MFFKKSNLSLAILLGAFCLISANTPESASKYVVSLKMVNSNQPEFQDVVIQLSARCNKKYFNLAFSPIDYKFDQGGFKTISKEVDWEDCTLNELEHINVALQSNVELVTDDSKFEIYAYEINVASSIEPNAPKKYLARSKNFDLTAEKQVAFEPVAEAGQYDYTLTLKYKSDTQSNGTLFVQVWCLTLQPKIIDDAIFRIEPLSSEYVELKKDVDLSSCKHQQISKVSALWMYDPDYSEDDPLPDVKVNSIQLHARTKEGEDVAELSKNFLDKEKTFEPAVNFDFSTKI